MGVISRTDFMADLYKGNLTEGSITGTMLRFAFPLMLGNLLQQCYNVADTLIVGRVLGADALAAVGSSYALIVFVTSIFIGLCMGCSAVFSMQYGAREFDGLRRSIFSSMLIVGGVTLVLNVASLLWLTPVIRLLHTPPEVEPLARSYLFIVFLGMVPVCVYNFYAFLLRAVGNSVVPLCFLLVSVVLNIGLDLLFMLGLHMGVEGAALATVVAQTVAALGLYLYTRRRFPALRLRKADCVVDFLSIRRGIRSAVWLTTAFALLVSALVFVGAPWLMSLFVSPSEAEIIAIGVEYLRIEGSFYVGIGYLFLLYGFYRAVALPSMSVVLTVVSLGTRVLLAYLLASLPQVGYTGIWWSVPIGWALADVVGVWYYRSKPNFFR